MTAVRSRFGCSWQRNASVLLWTPVLLLGPVLDLHGDPVDVVFQVTMILVIGFITAAFTHYLYGGIVAGQKMRSTQAARVHLFLCSALSAYVTGETIMVDGGFSIWNGT